MTNQVAINTNNVVGYKNDSVSSKVDMFLAMVRENSENTYTSYKGHIAEYFMYVVGKDIVDLEWNDLYQITVDDTDRYRIYLRQKSYKTKKDENGKWEYKRGQSTSTIKSKIASMKSLFDYLARRDEKKIINSDVVVTEKIKADKRNNSYGSLTQEEFNSLLDFCDKEKIKPMMKRMFFELALNTGMRKTAILDNLKWVNIQMEKDNNTRIDVRVIKNVEDKGGKFDATPISDVFYDRLMDFRDCDESEYYSYEDRDKNVISLNTKTVDSVLKRFKEEYGIAKERKITVHSIKSTGCDIVWERTKDIKAVSDYAHHSDINTTYKHYLGKNESLMDKASYYAFDSVIDLGELEDMSKEDIIKLINECSISARSEILSRI